MNTTTRRNFLSTFLLLPFGLYGLKDAAGNSHSMQVLYASAFVAPFLTDRLCPGQPLQVRYQREKVCLMLGSDLVGLLPENATNTWKRAMREGRPLRFSVNRIERSPQGRLLLFANCY